MKKFIIFLFFFLTACTSFKEFTVEQRVENFLDEFNQQYRKRDLQGIVAKIDEDYPDASDLKLAIENDFNAFISVDYSVSIESVKYDKILNTYTINVFFQRTSRTVRFGTDNFSGKAKITLVERDGQFFIRKFDGIYGAISP
ncbi:MAG: hypothetical protein MJ250_03305 [Alphaproteobacteria bacterium]|nr:hypothetical protein [Alphaproteobacteria bacterium]